MAVGCSGPLGVGCAGVGGRGGLPRLLADVMNLHHLHVGASSNRKVAKFAVVLVCVCWANLLLCFSECTQLEHTWLA